MFGFSCGSWLEWSHFFVIIQIWPFGCLAIPYCRAYISTANQKKQLGAFPTAGMGAGCASRPSVELVVGRFLGGGFSLYFDYSTYDSSNRRRGHLVAGCIKVAMLGKSVRRYENTVDICSTTGAEYISHSLVRGTSIQRSANRLQYKPVSSTYQGCTYVAVNQRLVLPVTCRYSIIARPLQWPLLLECR